MYAAISLSADDRQFHLIIGNTIMDSIEDFIGMPIRKIYNDFPQTVMQFSISFTFLDPDLGISGISTVLVINAWKSIIQRARQACVVCVLPKGFLWLWR